MPDVRETLESTAALHQGGFATSVIVIRAGHQLDPQDNVITHLSEADAMMVLGQLSYLRASIEEDLIVKAKTRKYIKQLLSALPSAEAEARVAILAELEEFKAAGYAVSE